MNEEQARALHRLYELHDEAPGGVEVNRLARIEEDLNSGYEDVWRAAISEIDEIWLEVLWAVSEKLEDDHLSAIGKRLLLAIQTLAAIYPALGFETPNFTKDLFSGDPRNARKAISQMRRILQFALAEMQRQRANLGAPTLGS